MQVVRLPFLVAALVFSVGPGHTQVRSDQPNQQRYLGGAELLPEAEYNALPKTQLHRAYLPISIDLSDRMPAPGVQGHQGSCVGWAVGYAVRAFYANTLERRRLDLSENVPSPAYIYRALTTDPRCQRGIPIPRALELLRSGALSLSEFPYNDALCTAPDARIRARAVDFRISQWQSVNGRNIDQVKAQLATGHPLVLGKRFADSFQRHVGESVYRRGRGEAGQLNHAVAVVGYDDQKQALRVLNSWGQEWGDRGYAWISYDEITSAASEIYTIRPHLRSPEPPPPPTTYEPQVTTTGPSPDEEFVELVPPTQCGKVSIEVVGGRRIARGFVGSDAELDALRLRLAVQAIETQVEVQPWPQCEVSMTLQNALAAPDPPKVQVASSKNELREGDDLLVAITAPDAPAHVHVAYVQADGKVVHLMQSEATNMRALNPREQIVFGDGRGDGTRLRIAPPFGREMIVALASRSPLFEEPRPAVETEREFLTALRREIALRHQTAGRTVRASVATLTTRELK